MTRYAETTDNGGPAYPVNTTNDGTPGAAYCHEGMTLRQYYKAAALKGLLASGPHDCEVAELVHDAALYADAMLQEDLKHA